MKKINFLSLILLACCSGMFAQSIGINGTGASPDTSAILDVSSTTKGFLMPRMTSSQISAIGAPAKGMGVYNTSINSFQTNIGTSGTPSWGTVATRTNHVIVHRCRFPCGIGRYHHFNCRNFIRDQWNGYTHR